MSKIENPHLNKKQIVEQDQEDQLDDNYDFDLDNELDFDSELDGELNLDGELDSSAELNLNETSQPATTSKTRLNTQNQAYKNLTAQPFPNAGTANPNVKNMGGVATGADFTMIQQNPDAQQFILNLKDQGVSNDQIKSMFQSQFGETLSDESILYFTEGPQAFDSGHTVTKYAASYGPLTKQIGIQNSPFVSDFLTKLQEQQMTSEAKDKLRDAKKSGEKDMNDFKKMALLIAMGDVESAVKLYARTEEKQTRRISKTLLEKLIKVSEVRSRMMTVAANLTPPRASGSPDPKVQARISTATQKYQASVQQLSQTQSMLGDATRDTMDEIKSCREKINTIYELASTMAESKGRSMSKTIG